MKKTMARNLFLVSTLMFNCESWSSPVVNSQTLTTPEQSSKLKKLLTEKDDLEQQMQKMYEELIGVITKTDIKRPISPDCQQEIKALQGDITKFSKKCLDEQRGQLKYMQNHQDDRNKLVDEGQKIHNEMLQNQLSIIKELEKVAS